MSDDNSILGLSRKGNMSAGITYLMLKGAGYALIVVLAIWLLMSVVAALGRALPAESRETPDPINRSDLVLPELELRVV